MGISNIDNQQHLTPPMPLFKGEKGFLLLNQITLQGTLQSP